MQAAALPPPLRAAREVPPHATALDARQEWQSFSRRLHADGEAERWESTLWIDGMDCAACTLAVEDALRPVPGVLDVQVNGATAMARVVWDPRQGAPSQWVAALARAGYGALPAGDALADGAKARAGRVLLWRWLVAGFCMMQVMMYATPAYIAQPGEITPDMEALLRWASWILTLPVLLFSSKPFFRSAWRDLRNRTVGMDVPVALGIAIAFAASTAATFDPQGPLGREVWFDSVTMFVFFLLSSRLLEQRLRDRTAGALQALVRSLPQLAEREGPDGSWEQVPLRSLRPGDRVRVRAGETIPVDGIVLEGASQLDEALLTGESRPVARRSCDAVIAGSHNLSGTLCIAVERTGPDTRFAAIVALMERASVERPRLARLADRAARPFLVAVVVAAAGAAWCWWPQGAAQALGIAVSVLIVTCPCALSLATPAATLAAAGALARRGVLVRSPDALETAASLDTVVFDKTGTLTQDRMAVLQVRTRAGTQAGEATRLAAALARHSLHPASRAVAAAAGAVGWTAADVREHAGQGIEGVVQAREGWAPRTLRLGSAAFCGVPAGAASGSSEVHLADASGWLATFVLDETLRPDARTAVGTLMRMGLAVHLLSGDRAASVQRLAWRAGIEHSLAGQSPQDKLQAVASQQAAGRRVAMVGDGMNDGPVLARADVAIAMGEGVPVAQATADFVVLGNVLGRVPEIIALARRTRRVVRQNLAWSAGYNAVCVPLAVAGFMPPWLAGLGMAASSLAVVANAARLARIQD